MTTEQAIEILKEHKEQIDKKYINTRNSKAIETVLSMLKEKDQIIDLMANEIANNIANTCPLEDYNYDLDCENKCNDNYKECWKQYFENKAKELLNK